MNITVKFTPTSLGFFSSLLFFFCCLSYNQCELHVTTIPQQLQMHYCTAIVFFHKTVQSQAEGMRNDIYHKEMASMLFFVLLSM